MAARGDDRSTDPRVARTREDVPRAAFRILVDEGADAVTHTHVAQVAGYSKATLYTHWPTRNDLLRATFSLLADMEHHQPRGNLRDDLVGEITAFRRAMTDRGIDRALAAMADVTASSAELARLRDEITVEGERVLRELLGRVSDGVELEAAAMMLSGAVLYGAMLHGTPPDEDVLGAAVDLVLRGLRAGQDG